MHMTLDRMVFLRNLGVRGEKKHCSFVIRLIAKKVLFYTKTSNKRLQILTKKL